MLRRQQSVQQAAITRRSARSRWRNFLQFLIAYVCFRVREAIAETVRNRPQPVKEMRGFKPPIFDGNIYEVDPTSRLITAVIDTLA